MVTNLKADTSYPMPGSNGPDFLRRMPFHDAVSGLQDTVYGKDADGLKASERVGRLTRQAINASYAGQRLSEVMTRIRTDHFLPSLLQCFKAWKDKCAQNTGVTPQTLTNRAIDEAAVLRFIAEKRYLFIADCIETIIAESKDCAKVFVSYDELNQPYPKSAVELVSDFLGINYNTKARCKNRSLRRHTSDKVGLYEAAIAKRIERKAAQAAKAAAPAPLIPDPMEELAGMAA